MILFSIKNVLIRRPEAKKKKKINLNLNLIYIKINTNWISV